MTADVLLFPRSESTSGLFYGALQVIDLRYWRRQHAAAPKHLSECFPMRHTYNRWICPTCQKKNAVVFIRAVNGQAICFDCGYNADQHMPFIMDTESFHHWPHLVQKRRFTTSDCIQQIQWDETWDALSNFAVID